MPKYHIITFGCQMNKSDSERIATVLEKEGYKLASKINEGEENKFSSSPFAKAQEADLIVVNMCSVRQSAVDRVFGLSQKLSKLKAQNPNLKNILTGCILKKDKRKFADRFDLILNIKDLSKWTQFLSFNESRPRCGEYLKIKPKYSNSFSAFVPISNGCNNFCAYCVVPFTRGPLVCRPHQEILNEVNGLVKRGFKEIWLLGQNVNDYHSPTDSSIDFPKLLKQINEIPGKFWIRFTSPHPKNFSDELIEIMISAEKVTPYLNLPVQSGDNAILKKMNRPYTVEQYKKLVKKIREKFTKIRGKLEPISISTDIIVGFPRETKRQFQNTVKLFKEIKYDMAFIAKYSPRPQTAAFKLKDDISYQEKERRYKHLVDVLKKTALEKNQLYIGKEVEVLINESRIMNHESRIFFGKTQAYKTVKIHNSKFLTHNSDPIGQFVKVKIIDALPWGLKGTAL